MVIDTAMFTTEQVRRFQELLVGARRMRGLTQIEAARQIGVSQTLISMLERGPHKGMRVDELFRILAFYGIEPNLVAEALGYVEPGQMTTQADDPRVALLIAQLQALPDETADTLLTALEWMLRGSR